MIKVVHKYAILVLSILLADLLGLYALNILDKSRSNQHPYQSSALTMLVLVFIFYPAFQFAEKYLVIFSNRFMKKSAKTARFKFLGQLMGFLLAIFILWIAYTNALYHTNPLVDAGSELKNFSH